MKWNPTLLFVLPLSAFLVATLPSCEQRREGPAENIGEAIDDATDSRPAEGIKDAVEDVEDALKNGN